MAYVTMAQVLGLHNSTFSCKPRQKKEDDFLCFVYSVCIYIFRDSQSVYYQRNVWAAILKSASFCGWHCSIVTLFNRPLIMASSNTWRAYQCSLIDAMEITLQIWLIDWCAETSIQNFYLTSFSCSTVRSQFWSTTFCECLIVFFYSFHFLQWNIWMKINHLNSICILMKQAHKDW